MIWKELDPFPPTDDPLLCAGRRAEEQMAYYLRRAFGDSKEVSVLNGIRLQYRQSDGTEMYVQVDHLILHRFGMIAIESKSVSGTVLINERGEWMRKWGQEEKRGMSSPVLQAKEQARIIINILDDNASLLVGKILGLQVQFGGFQKEALVAISDNGIINFPENIKLPEVCKADQIPQKVRECINKQKWATTPLNLSLSGGIWLKQEEIDNICYFIRNNHQPARCGSLEKRNSVMPTVVREKGVPNYMPVAPVQPAAPPPKPAINVKTEFMCRNCSSDCLVMLWGQYGYYFKCSDCNKNTPVDKSVLYCRDCRTKKRIRKDRDNFFIECDVCAAAGKSDSPSLLYTNPRGVTA